jgi:hypothetical protein
MQEDPIVSPTLSPYTSVDLGARSLVGGVDCNNPEKSPILELLVIFFFGHCDIMHYHASITLHFYCQTQNYFEIKSIFSMLVCCYNKPSFLSSYFN